MKMQEQKQPMRKEEMSQPTYSTMQQLTRGASSNQQAALASAGRDSSNSSSGLFGLFGGLRPNSNSRASRAASTLAATVEEKGGALPEGQLPPLASVANSEPDVDEQATSQAAGGMLTARL